MAHSTAIPAASHSDWYTILCSALIDGLKAYGASLMSIAPIDHLESQTNPTAPTRNAPILRTAGCPIHRAASSRDGWETTTLPLLPLTPLAPLTPPTPLKLNP
jgi:hypothetical protein